MGIVYSAWPQKSPDGNACRDLMQSGYEPQFHSKRDVQTCAENVKDERCVTNAVISAFDGVLQGEHDSGVTDSNVLIGVAWSAGINYCFHESCKNQLEKADELYGFKNVQVCMENAYACGNQYAFVTTANVVYATYQRRWLNAMNVQQTWMSYAKSHFVEQYMNTPDADPDGNWGPHVDFGTIPLFFSSFESTDEDDMAASLTDMISTANKSGGKFLGFCVKGFMQGILDIGDTDPEKLMFVPGTQTLGDLHLEREDPYRMKITIKADATLPCLKENEGILMSASAVSKAFQGHNPDRAVGFCIPEASATEDSSVEFAI